MIAKKRMPAPAPRLHPTEAIGGADEEHVQPLKPRRSRLSRRDLGADSDRAPYAVKGKSHRPRHD